MHNDDVALVRRLRPN